MNEKALWIGGGILGGILLAYAIFQAGRQKEIRSTVLRKGDTGLPVVELQKRLVSASPVAARKIIETGGADGKFGPGTEAALKAVTGQKEIEMREAVSPTTTIDKIRFAFIPD